MSFGLDHLVGNFSATLNDSLSSKMPYLFGFKYIRSEVLLHRLVDAVIEAWTFARIARLRPIFMCSQRC
jgi:hypothetical protein